MTTWLAGNESRERLTYQNAERVGIGINGTDDGRAYLTANLC